MPAAGWLACGQELNGSSQQIAMGDTQRVAHHMQSAAACRSAAPTLHIEADGHAAGADADAPQQRLRQLAPALRLARLHLVPAPAPRRQRDKVQGGTGGTLGPGAAAVCDADGQQGEPDQPAIPGAGCRQFSGRCAHRRRSSSGRSCARLAARSTSAATAAATGGGSLLLLLCKGFQGRVKLSAAGRFY